MIPVRAYRAVFVVGVAALAAGVGLGLYHSLVEERRIPSPRVADLVAAHLEQIERLMQSGQTALAVDQLRLTLLLLHSDRHLTHNMLGNALEDLGETDAAIRHYREALALAPGFATAHHNLGLAYARRGQLDAAIAEVAESLRLRPDFVEASRNLILLRRRLEEGEQRGEGKPEALLRGRSYVRQFYRGELESLHRGFSADFAREMSPDMLREVHARVARQLGVETALLHESLTPVRDGTLYVRRARFESYEGEVEVLIKLDAGMAVGGLFFQPADAPAAQPEGGAGS